MSAGLPPLCSVAAVGARTPLGLDACQTGMLFRAGFATMAPAPLGPDGEDITVCHQSSLNPALSGSERAVELALPALAELLEALRDHRRDERVTLYLALDADQAEPEAIAARLLDQCQRVFVSAQLEVAARSEGGAALLLARARAALAGQQIDLALLGGVHSDYDPARIARLLAQDRLYSDDNLDAILPGESAAFVALVAPADGPSSILQPLAAHICGIGNAVAEARPDNALPSAPARGATAAMRAATAELEAQKQHAGWLLTDTGFEAWRTREACTVYTRATPILGEPYRLDCPVQRVGSLGAAAIPLCIAIAAEGFERGYAPSSTALVLAGSETGERGAVLLTSTKVR